MTWVGLGWGGLRAVDQRPSLRYFPWPPTISLRTSASHQEEWFQKKCIKRNMLKNKMLGPVGGYNKFQDISYRPTGFKKLQKSSVGARWTLKWLAKIGRIGQRVAIYNEVMQKYFSMSIELDLKTMMRTNSANLEVRETTLIPDPFNYCYCNTIKTGRQIVSISFPY